MTEVRFWSSVDRRADGCWLWLGWCRGDGYGQARFRGRMFYVHRLAWLLLRGSIPEGLHIDHLCRVKRCCNPAHLEPVTPAENSRRCPPYRRRHWKPCVG